MVRRGRRQGRCPIVDTWWQTETGGDLITPAARRHRDQAGLGDAAVLRGAAGGARPATGAEITTTEAEGVLAISDSWPGQMRTIWGDHARFVETYFSQYKGTYFTGDGCRRDADGYYWITGRVDDVINVSGHRMGTAEVESALVAHEKVAEAAVVGYPHPIKGQGIYGYVTLMAGEEYTEAPAPRAHRLGAPGDRPDRLARPDPVGARPAQDPLGQDHAPHPAQDRRERLRHPRRHLHPRRPDRRRRPHRQPHEPRLKPNLKRCNPTNHPEEYQMAYVATAGLPAAPMTREEKKVIFASSLGTVFEWYDFYLYGSLSAVIAAQFFSGVNPTAAFIFALMAFAAGFAVRPFGALVFGRLGDMIGRKYTFLVTILIMGLSTFIVGILPNYAAIGIAAPIILICLRLLQGLALGGEYGGAATYVAEHAPHGRRGAYTSWIQTTATLGLFLSLLVILGCRVSMSAEDFASWGWRIPFMVSIILLGVSVWIRLMLNESPAFQKMKDEGTTSKAPLKESFGHWKNLKVVLLALFGLVAGQAVVWYTGQFYALFFLTQTLKVDAQAANLMIAGALLLATPFFVIFGSLSDRIGRKPIIMAGLLLACLTYFPMFKGITHFANPGLEEAIAASPVVVTADPNECSFQFNPVGTSAFTTSCDIAKTALVKRGIPYSNVEAPAGTVATVAVGDTVISVGRRRAGRAGDGQRRACPGSGSRRRRDRREVAQGGVRGRSRYGPRSREVPGEGRPRPAPTRRWWCFC